MTFVFPNPDSKGNRSFLTITQSKKAREEAMNKEKKIIEKIIPLTWPRHVEEDHSWLHESNLKKVLTPK